MAFTPDEARRARGVELLGAVARDIAHPVATYYRALREEGVGRLDARALAIAFMHRLLDELEKAS